MPEYDERLISWIIEPSSTLSIRGSSNVSDFTCGMDVYRKKDTLTITENTPSFIKFFESRLAVPINDFDCRHKLITRDFQETLLASQYPEIGITFISFLRVADARQGVDSYDADVLIELAGKKRKVKIHFDFSEQSYAQYLLKGSKVLRFSDFDFKPPTKMMGLVQVDDELTIHFNLIVRPL